jgi:tetratricopeptide (TPR) repeat protein
VGCIVCGLLAVGLALFFLVIRPTLRHAKAYNAGVDLLNANDYAAAADAFRELGGYSDAEQMADYADAMEAMEKENYKKAASLLSELGDFMDAPAQLTKAKGELLYVDAVAAMEQGDYGEALAAFEQIPDVRDAETLAGQCRSHVAYGEAQTLFSSGSYSEALALLKDVTGIPEAEDLRKQCESWIALTEAQEQYDAGAYAEALSRLEDVQGIPEAETLRKKCQDRITYANALEKYDAGEYAEAAELFSQVPKVENASKLLKECQKKVQYAKIQTALDQKDWATALALLNDSLAQDYPDRKNLQKLCQNHARYDEGVKTLAEGKNYTAYKIFQALGNFEDAAAKADSCIVSKPKSGETYRNKNYSRKVSPLKVVTPNDGNYTYVKIYAKKGISEELVSCLFIHPGKSVQVQLPTGDYCCKIAYGKGDWFGPTDLFGDDGNYIRFKDTLTLTKKEGIQLTLRVKSGGNIDSSKVSRDEF